MATPVQFKSNSVGSLTTLTVTFDSNVTAGNLIAVGVAWFSGGTTLDSITDSLGNSYTILDNPTTVAAAGSGAMAYAKNILGGACTITLTVSANSTEFMAMAGEIAGRHLTSPLDGHVMNAESFVGSPRTSTAIVTTVASDYVFGFCMNINGNTFTPGSGFLTVDTVGTNKATYEDQTQVSAGSIAATFTLSGDGNSVSGIMAFKLASSGPTPAQLIPAFTQTGGGYGVQYV